MLATSKLQEDQQFFDGWVKSYIDVMKPTQFPLSYQTLIGASILTSIIGKKAAVKGFGYTLYPPLWLFLGGTSGIGKSQSMKWARKVLDLAADSLQNEPFMVWFPDTFTRRGIVQHGKRVQEAFGADYVEGMLLIDEFSSVMAKRTGTETMAGFFVRLADMETVEDETGERGLQILRNPRLGCIVASSMESLRKVIDLDLFTGGLFFRFFVLHEVDVAKDLGADPHPPFLQGLAAEAVKLRNEAPEFMVLDKDVRPELQRIRRQRLHQSTRTANSMGFFQRFDAMVLKLAQAMAISNGSFRMTVEDITRAHDFILYKVYPPVQEIIEEMRFGKERAQLMSVADDLALAGPEGMSMKEFMRKLPLRKQARNEQLQWLRYHGFIHEGKKAGQEWVWRMAEWAAGGEDV